MRYEFHPEALEEYRQTALWYAEREPTVALQFIASVEDAIKRVVDAPTRWRVIEEDVRRCLTHVFPYAILYTIEPDFLLIVAVMHCSREPGPIITQMIFAPSSLPTKYSATKNPS